MSMKTYIAAFRVAFYSTRPPVRVPVHVCRWFFPAFFARRAAVKYGKRRNWTLVQLKPLP